MKKINDNIDKTMLTITVGFMVLHYFTGNDWLLILAITLGVIGLLSKVLSRRIDFIWTKLAWILSLIVPNILLSIIFFAVLTPLAWLSKLFGPPNPLDLKNKSNSLFKTKEKTFDKSSFEKAW